MPHATFQLRGHCSRAGYDQIDTMLRDLCVLYNAALEERIGAYRKQHKSIAAYDQHQSFTRIRHDDPDGFGKQDVRLGRGTLAQLDRAFNAFFRRVKRSEKPGFPRFRSQHRFKCINMLNPRSGQIQQRGRKTWVKIKGLPRIKLRLNRSLPDSTQLKSLRIIRRETGVTVDLVYEVEKTPLSGCERSVGIDMGVRKRMTLSTGERIARRQNTAEDQAVTRQQQRITRCSRGSNTRRKQVRQLARLRRRQVVRNRNACHRITTDLIRCFGMIAVEQLAVKDMTRSVAGTTEKPGTGVAQKRGLNRVILEQTWGLLRQQLAYKAEWAGREFVTVPAAFTSQDCSRCGHRHDLGKSETYGCSACGLEMDRDHNAALNILRAGTVALAERQKGITDPVGSGV